MSMSMSTTLQEQQQWSSSSIRKQQEHQAIVQQLEAARIAATLTHVPTLPHQVRDALRALNQPVRLFGENLANVRDRLRHELAILQMQSNQSPLQTTTTNLGVEKKAAGDTTTDNEPTETQYTRAATSLLEARQHIALFSLERARIRLERERRLRAYNDNSERGKRKQSVHGENGNDDDNDNETTASMALEEDEECMMIQCEKELNHIHLHAKMAFRRLRNLALEGSQYCDSRALSSIRVVPTLEPASASSSSHIIVAGSWTSTLHVLDPQLQTIGSHARCHEDRIMSIDAIRLPYSTFQNDVGDPNNDNGSDISVALVATASLDGTAKVFRVGRSLQHQNIDADDNKDEKSVPSNTSTQCVIIEQSHLQGHAKRLCRIVFHPAGLHLATTSFDHTWRLWDIKTSVCLLLQDGHANECYGVGCHPDGSLLATSDLGGIVHLWDLRTGKSIAWYRSHAGKVLNTSFHPNGMQLATAGQDGCIHLWDLRKRVKLPISHTLITPQTTTSVPIVSIPAHNKIITSLRFDPAGEYLCSSSFDGTVKVWNCRNWKLLNSLMGHEGTVTDADILPPSPSFSSRHYHARGGLVTSGFDKTVKLWK